MENVQNWHKNIIAPHNTFNYNLVTIRLNERR